MAPEDPQLQTERIYELFFEIAKSEQSFNTIQTKYQQMASLWMLAAFAAIGYVLTKDPVLEPNHVYLNAFVISFVICISTIIGLGLLWTIDILVYHRLLDAYFVTGLVLERTYTFLPPVRHLMRSKNRGNGKGRGVGIPLVTFYVVPMGVFTFFAAMTFIWYCFPLFSVWSWNSNSLCTQVFVSVIFAFAAVCCYWGGRGMYRLSDNKQLFDHPRLRGPKALPLPSVLEEH